MPSVGFMLYAICKVPERRTSYVNATRLQRNIAKAIERKAKGKA